MSINKFLSLQRLPEIRRKATKPKPGLYHLDLEPESLVGSSIEHLEGGMKAIFTCLSLDLRLELGVREICME